jgi:hypothetical protein
LAAITIGRFSGHRVRCKQHAGDLVDRQRTTDDDSTT